MPRFPDFSARVDCIGGSVFERFRDQMARHGDGLLKLQIGDTYLPPEYPLPLAADFLGDHADFNRYCNTFGIAPLRAAVLEKVREDNGLPAGPKHVLLTAGAANALNVAAMGLLQPDDEILVCTPAWPFFFGMARVAGARVAEVPLYMRLYAQPHLDVAELLEQHRTPRTVALYVNSPNNPSGKVLERAHLEQIAAFARQHALWVISDEAYDGLTFDGRPTHSIGSLPGLFEQTLSIFSFSKTYMSAGLRLGYVVGNETAIRTLNKLMIHELYSPSTLGQHLMVAPVRTRAEWIPRVRERYQRLRDSVAGGLGVRCPLPEGGTFFFVPLREELRGRTVWELIARWLEAGVAVAPGLDFGSAYEDHVRICFTGEPPDRLETAIDRWRAILRS